MKTARRLEWRKDNAGNHILLIDAGEVVGAWPVVSRKEVDDYIAARCGRQDLADWSETWPDETDPERYGDLIDDSEWVRLDIKGRSQRETWKSWMGF